MIYMTNKIVAIQGDNLKKINIKTDTTIFLANEAQNKGYKLFYYYQENLSNIRGKTVSEGYFIKIDYSKKKRNPRFNYINVNVIRHCIFINNCSLYCCENICLYLCLPLNT